MPIGPLELVIVLTRKRNRHDRPLLCGVDATAGDRAVVSIAGALAARLHAPLILVHVDSDGEPRSARTGEWARRLLDTSDMRSLRGVEVRTRWEYGDPTTRLLDMVEQENARLLLVR
jgi:K+-sensing histidine kinase KdpD